MIAGLELVIAGKVTTQTYCVQLDCPAMGLPHSLTKVSIITSVEAFFFFGVIA